MGGGTGAFGALHEEAAGDPEGIRAEQPAPECFAEEVLPLAGCEWAELSDAIGTPGDLLAAKLLDECLGSGACEIVVGHVEDHRREVLDYFKLLCGHSIVHGRHARPMPGEVEGNKKIAGLG
jgi:hypothetical protein